MNVEVTTWYLEMRSPAAFRPSYVDYPDVQIHHAKTPSPEFSRFLYTSVGGDWYWCDRLSWTRDRWWTYLDRPEVETWVAYVAGTPAGYVELERQPDNNVEIAYFGLLPAFIGQGIGKHLLSTGTQRAWDWGAERVWVHTCSLDEEYALANYQARGFTLYDQKQHIETMPERSPSFWSGIGG